MQVQVKVEFGKVTFGDKITMPISIKGDLSDEQTMTLIKLASTGNGVALLSSAQMDIDDIEKDHEGFEYTVNGDGTVDVDENQMSIEDIETEKDNEEDTE